MLMVSLCRRRRCCRLSVELPATGGMSQRQLQLQRSDRGVRPRRIPMLGCAVVVCDGDGVDDGGAGVDCDDGSVAVALRRLF